MAFNDKFLEDNSIEEVISGEIDNIFDNFSRAVSEKWLATLDIPLCAEIAMMKMRKIVAWATFEHDGVVQANVCLEKLIPDGEPSTISIDPWARGTGTFLNDQVKT